MNRPIVSYDDITLPYESSSFDASQSPTNGNSSRHSNGNTNSKKRKWGGQNNNNRGHSSARGKTYQNSTKSQDLEEDEDSRFLTQEEAWDDSALIDAWNAANEEYEALNGPGKGWKNEPICRSSLWYNTPPSEPAKKRPKTESEIVPELTNGGDGETDSTPIDFSSFVPNHDASLAAPQEGEAAPGPVPPASAAYMPVPTEMTSQIDPRSVSQDDAFSRALSAMYWGGYWTAVYQCHRGTASDARVFPSVGSDEGVEDEDDNDSDESEDEVDQGFVSTQR